MDERMLVLLSLSVLAIIGVSAVLLSAYAQSPSWRFPLAFYPLLVILFGVAFLRQSGLRMAFIGLVVAFTLAVTMFGTPAEVALGSSVYGFVKSFGISISVVGTMLMVFLMKEVGALQTVSTVIKRQVVGNEVMALYIGVGFGSFLSALGVVTPALFPPLLVTMGFSPVASIAIAVLGYDPTTSFSLLSIPITLPAQVGALNAIELAFKIAIFLPLVSTGFAFAILWLVGGRQAMRKGATPAVVCGLTLAFACLGTVSLDYFSGTEYIPLRIVGVVAGLCAMASLLAYQKLTHDAQARQTITDYPPRAEVLRAFSPWIVLSVLAVIISVPPVGGWLSNVLGGFEEITIFANQKIDLDVFAQIYTWIFVAVVLSLYTLRVKKNEARKALGVWVRRATGPFLAYSLYFSVSYVMANSATQILNGVLVNSSSYSSLNMNVILGTTLAAVFGVGYVFVAASLGLFGAVVGGSETSSIVLFLNIQKTAMSELGRQESFMTVYGSHAVGGGIASAITPAKISNAVATIDAGKETESLVMRKHLVVAVLLTIATGVLTGVLVNLGI